MGLFFSVIEKFNKKNINILFVFFLVSCSCFVEANRLAQEVRSYPRFSVDPVIQCDLEMILNGGFSPLEGFLTQKDYHSVLENIRLSSGELWPIPIVFPIHESRKQEVQKAKRILLVDETNLPLAVLEVEDIYRPDLEKECRSLVGCVDDNHAFSKRILAFQNHYYVGGKVCLINMPVRGDFRSFRMTPAESKEFIKKNKLQCVVGFQTRNPLHRCHIELGVQTLNKLKGQSPYLMLQPVVGVTQPGDIDYRTRVKCYEAALKYYPENQVKLCLLPLAMRMAGPKEALWHALVRKNYGCTHFIVGRHHASPSFTKKDGKPFFKPYDAQELLVQYQKEIGIKMIPSEELAYVEEKDTYLPVTEISQDMTVKKLSGTKLRQLLKTGEEIPSWFSYPEILQILKSDEKKQGICFYFTGLSGSGKTTLCRHIKSSLEELTKKPVVILDGDVFRRYITPDLGFSKADRSKNIRRMGYIASLIVESGGICLCANMAPYEEDRAHNRDLISKSGKYVEIYVNTPVEVCEQRDKKGLYRLAREGKITNMIGIDEEFEKGGDPEIVLSTDQNLTKVLEDLLREIKKYISKI